MIYLNTKLVTKKLIKTFFFILLAFVIGGCCYKTQKQKERRFFSEVIEKFRYSMMDLDRQEQNDLLESLQEKEKDTKEVKRYKMILKEIWFSNKDIPLKECKELMVFIQRTHFYGRDLTRLLNPYHLREKK